MTTDYLLLLGILLFLMSTASLVLSAVALLQTKALWSALKKHEIKCETTDEELFRELRKQFACCSKVQADILAGVTRLEGIDEGQRRIAQGGARKHG